MRTLSVNPVSTPLLPPYFSTVKKMSWQEENGSALWSGSGVVSDNTTTATLDCASKGIQDPTELPFSASMLTTITVLQSAFYLMLFFLGSFLNGFVIVLVVKYKKLHTLTFGIALQVMAVDLFSSFVLGLFGFISSVVDRWIFGKYVCVLTGTLLIMVSVSRASIMFVFVLDRFLSVFIPFGYPKFQNKVVVTLSVASWVFALVTSSIGIGLDCYTFFSEFSLCLYSSTCNDNCSAYFGVSFATFTVPVTIIPIILYIFLFIKAKKAKNAIMESAGLAEKYKSDRKATITFFIMFIAIFAFFFPTSVVSFLFRLLHQEEVLAFLRIFNGTIYSLFVISDPIVILRNGDVKEVLKKIMSMFKKNAVKPEEIEMKSRNVTLKAED